MSATTGPDVNPRHMWMESVAKGRDRSVGVIGAGAITAGVVSAAVMTAGRFPRLDTPSAAYPEGTLFGLGQALLIVAIVVTGGLLLVARRSVWATAGISVTGLMAAELAGVGIVSIRRWGLFVGTGYAHHPVVGWEQGRVLAAGMGLACAALAVMCLVVVLRRGAHWHPVRAAVAVPAAVVVAVAAPLSVQTPLNDRSDLIAWAVMYAGPFAAALTLTALLPRPAGLLITLTIAVSVLVAPLGGSFLENMAPSGPAQPVVLIAVSATAVTLIITRSRPQSTGRNPVTSQG